MANTGRPTSSSDISLFNHCHSMLDPTGQRPAAFVSYDGSASDFATGIRRSYNVTSITDDSVGISTINLTSSVTNPIIQATTAAINAGIGEISTASDIPQTGAISSITVVTNRNGGGCDSKYVSVAVW